MLGECILHFWKPPIFINLAQTGQGHSCILNTYKSILKIAGFILVYVLAGCIIFWESVGMKIRVRCLGPCCMIYTLALDYMFVFHLEFSRTKVN